MIKGKKTVWSKALGKVWPIKSYFIFTYFDKAIYVWLGQKAFCIWFIVSFQCHPITIICTLSKFHNDSDEDRTMKVQVHL